MRILKILLIGLLFINCTSQVKEPVYTYELSKELQPYVFEYLSTLEKYDIKFKKQSFIVVFDADIMRTPLVGQAKGMFNDSLVYVKINPSLWQELTIKTKKTFNISRTITRYIQHITHRRYRTNEAVNG